ncbi:MAG: hypothetical protein ACP5G1_00005, partial [Nanopusillaceae archaeon]
NNIRLKHDIVEELPPKLKEIRERNPELKEIKERNKELLLTYSVALGKIYFKTSEPFIEYNALLYSML